MPNWIRFTFTEAHRKKKTTEMLAETTTSKRKGEMENQVDKNASHPYVYRVMFSIDVSLKGMQLYFIIELKPEWLTFNFRDNFMREIHIFRKTNVAGQKQIPYGFDWVMCDIRCRAYYEPPTECIIAPISDGEKWNEKNSIWKAWNAIVPYFPLWWAQHSGEDAFLIEWGNSLVLLLVSWQWR